LLRSAPGDVCGPKFGCQNVEHRLAAAEAVGVTEIDLWAFDYSPAGVFPGGPHIGNASLDAVWWARLRQWKQNRTQLAVPKSSLPVEHSVEVAVTTTATGAPLAGALVTDHFAPDDRTSAARLRTDHKGRGSYGGFEGAHARTRAVVGKGSLRARASPALQPSLRPLWNSPFPTEGACSSKAEYALQFAQFGIAANINSSFNGNRVGTLYDLGNMPSYLKNADGTHTPLHGGLPQLVDMHDHLAAFKAIVESTFPDPEFSGVVAMDWETWYPTFDMLYDSMAVYADESVKHVLRQQPGLNATAARARAAAEFNAGAKALLLETLRLAKVLRPRGLWGYYDYPRCMSYSDCMGSDGTKAASQGDTTCSPDQQRYNDVEIAWLLDEVTAFFPSLYLQSTTNRSLNLLYTKCMTAEAMRVARASPSRPASPVFPYTWYSYDTADPYGTYLSEPDAVAEWDTPVAMGASGLVLYGGSGDCGNETLCARLDEYVRDELGPRMKRLVDEAEQCALANCSGHGRCVSMPVERCDCDASRSGSRCQHPSYTSQEAVDKRATATSPDDTTVVGQKTDDSTPAVASNVVGRMPGILAGQQFSVTVAAGGAAILTGPSGEHLTTVSSQFSEPGPRWHNFTASAAPPPSGWAVRVDRSGAAVGRWIVRAQAARYGLTRVYSLDPPPPRAPRRLLVNDTFRTSARGGPLGQEQDSAVIGVFVRHRASVAATATAVDSALVPGTFSPGQCSTGDNPGDMCGADCPDPAALLMNNGRPDVFANRSGDRGAGRSAFGVGLAALDDAFRVHALPRQYALSQTKHTTRKTACHVTSPPSIELQDPFLGLAASGDEYTQEWAIYPFLNCTDYYCFVNAHRHDLEADKLTMQLTGVLGPPDSIVEDTTIWQRAGYTECNHSGWSQKTKEQQAAVLASCWEHWPAEKFLDWMQSQTGPGGFIHGSNGDFIGDGVCGQVDVDGTRFVNQTERPPLLTTYIQNLVRAAKNANALLPKGAPKHKVLYYFHSYLSTGLHDLGRFNDSVLRGEDGAQQYYSNCTLKGGPEKVQLPLFYADGQNSYSKVLDQYVEEVFAMGANGLFHDEFPSSKYSFTYGSPWDNRSVFMDWNVESIGPTDGKWGTLAVRSKVASTVLLTHKHEMSIRKRVHDRGGVLVMNGAPATRSWIMGRDHWSHDSLPPSLNENENSIAWRSLFVQMYTPVMLTRYGGNLYDEDPRYNYSDCCLVNGNDDFQKRLDFMTTPCLAITDHLDFGLLSISYGGYFQNRTAPTIYSQMMPTTALEIGEGYVIGAERTITKTSGRYSAPTTGKYSSSTVYLFEDCYQVATVDGVLEVELTLQPRHIAIIVWRPAPPFSSPLKLDDGILSERTSITEVFSPGEGGYACSRVPSLVAIPSLPVHQLAFSPSRKREAHPGFPDVTT
jgi:hyaluronoglucosaminidase